MGFIVFSERFCFMEKMWAGRFAGELDRLANDFNSSIRFDCRMFRQDIRGSISHAEMLAKQGIISGEDAMQIIEGLIGILEDIEKGKLDFDPEAEDIHMFVESVLTKRIGDVGKRLHTARSRNDQVAVDVRLYLRDEVEEICGLVKELIAAVLEQAKSNADVICPGYTHLQRAQPIFFGHHLLCYCMMLIRDIGRLEDGAKRMNVCPLGSCALAGTTYDTDREFTASSLGFDGYTLNSIDGVSDRDFCLEIMSAFSILMMHLSRFSEEIIFWSSWECKFIELDDSYTTGSSIMPQKKNPDFAELIRGRTGRVYGDLVALLTMVKGLPLSYNRDMQEDKESLFDAYDTVSSCVEVFTRMIATARWNTERMAASCTGGHANATDVAEYLVRKGMPFRTAHGVAAKAVRICIEMGCNIEDLTLDDLKSCSNLIDSDIFSLITPDACMRARRLSGGPAPESVAVQITLLKAWCK